ARRPLPGRTQADDRRRAVPPAGPEEGARAARRRQLRRALPAPRPRDAGAVEGRGRRDPRGHRRAVGMTADPDAILVWGAGAVGGTIAAYLARAGHAVVAV